MAKKTYSRREFLRNSTIAAGALYLNMPKKVEASDSKKTRVVLVRDEKVLDKLYKPDAGIVQAMLDEAVLHLFDEKNEKAAWAKIVTPNDIVGIKTNVWRFLNTTKEVEQAIKNRVLEAGVSDRNISIRDRGLYNDKIFRNATALINARPMRTHHWSGVGTLLKNYITFSKSPASYHPDSCADLGRLWNLPQVKGKTKLNVLVMFTPLFHGVGPHHFSPQYTWTYNGLLIGTDPVAVDSVGIKIIQAQRKKYFGEERPINPSPKHVFLADTRHHIGTADPNKIELIKIGWKEGILI